MAAPQWQQEFGASFAVPDEITRHPQLCDQSWKNDSSPSFAWVDLAEFDDTRDLRLWVEHPEDEQREVQGGKRFAILYRDDRTDHQLVWEGDDVVEALAQFTESRKLAEAK